MKLDTLIKYWPILGVLLIGFGTEHLEVFYAEFNVDILQFIEWPEIVQSFLSTIIVLVFFGFVGTLQIFFMQDNTTILKETIMNQQTATETRFSRRLKGYFWGYALFFWLFLGNYFVKVLAFIFPIFKDESNWYTPILQYLITMSALIIVQEIALKLRTLNTSVHYKRYITFTFLLTVAFIAVAYISKEQAATLLKNKPTIATIKTKDNSVIQTNDTIVFVRKTNKFIFLFNTKQQKAQIIPFEEVTSLILGITKNRD